MSSGNQSLKEQMKAKILAIAVIGGMTIAMVVTAVGTVAQAVNDDAGGLDRDQLVSQIGGDRQQTGDSALVGGFKFVCPFH